LNDVTGGSGTTTLQVDALQLESTGTFGTTGQNLFVSLNPNLASIGTMMFSSIIASGGTFSSMLNLDLEFTLGSFTGMNVNNQICGGNAITGCMLSLSSGPNSFTRTPTPGSVEIAGVNLNLDGSNNLGDFWPGSLTESGPGASTHHIVRDAPVPIPGPVAGTGLPGLLFAGGALLFGWWRNRRRTNSVSFAAA
jgi:hypothetical protein